MGSCGSGCRKSSGDFSGVWETDERKYGDIDRRLCQSYQRWEATTTVYYRCRLVLQRRFALCLRGMGYPRANRQARQTTAAISSGPRHAVCNRQEGPQRRACGECDHRASVWDTRCGFRQHSPATRGRCSATTGAMRNQASIRWSPEPLTSMATSNLKRIRSRRRRHTGKTRGSSPGS